MRRLAFSLLCLLIILPLAKYADAFFRENQSSSPEQNIPARLIVKINSDLKVDPHRAENGLAYTGLQAFDSVNERFSIVRQKLMFPQKRQSRLPNTLKNIVVIDVPPGFDIFDLKNEYEQLDIVEYAEPDWPLELYGTPNDPLYVHQWYLNNTGQEFYSVLRVDGNFNDTLIMESGVYDADIDAQEVYESPPDNTGTVVVAIIDTGVDMDHPDLAEHIWTNPGEVPDNGLDDDHNGYIDDIHGWDYCGDTLPGLIIVPDNDPTDEHGHGTHCSGIVAAITDNSIGIAGITADCQIMPLKFHPYMLTSFAVEAIVYAAENGADVLSMSWGSFIGISVLEDALDYARSRGAVLCAAAGNYGCAEGDCDSPVIYPAYYPCVIAVGATNWLDQITYFSSFGDYLDLCAPGQSILSLRANSTDMYAEGYEPNVHIIDDYYYLASGTSMACPATAGAAALMRSVSWGLSPDAVQELLQNTADDYIDPYGTGKNLPGWDQYSGYGRINLFGALSMVPAVRTKIESPQLHEIISGAVDIIGTADGENFINYTVVYRHEGHQADWTILAASDIPVTDGILTQWDTGDLDGKYTIRLSSGETNFHMVTVNVANSPVADIISPGDNDTVYSFASIIGTASSPDMSYYELEYSHEDTPDDWIGLITSSIPVYEDELLFWNFPDYPDGQYNLRLSVYSGETLAAVETISLWLQSIWSTEHAWKVPIADTISEFPTYADIDNDGDNEIIIGTDHGIEFYNTDGTAKTTGIPEVPEYDFRVPIAVGYLDGDGIADFVALGLDRTYEVGKLFIYRSADSSFTVDLPYKPLVFYSGAEIQMPWISLKDINGDGLDEIHCYSGYTGNHHARYHMYNPDGIFRMEIPQYALGSSGYFAYLSADIDGDGIDEIYTASDSIYLADTLGNPVINFGLNILYDNFQTHNISAVDMDGDDRLELVVFGCYFWEHNYWTFVFDENLTLKDGWPHDSSIDYVWRARHPVFVDINNDDVLEYFIATDDIYYARILGWNIDGTPLRGDSSNATFVSVPGYGNIHPPIVVDFDGDGTSNLAAHIRPDLLLLNNSQSLMAWDDDGAVLRGWPIIILPELTEYPNRMIHVPVVGDINKDGNVDMITATGNNELVFINLENKPYSFSTLQVESYHYNRRMNYIGTIRSIGVVCGDVNGSGTTNLLDITFLIAYLYQDGPAPELPEIADVNSDGNINILDITYYISYLYKDGPELNCQ